MPKPDDWWIGPHFQHGSFGGAPTFDQKVLILADRIHGWMLDPAERMLQSDPQSDFAGLCVLSSYFEWIVKFKNGTATTRYISRESFVEGVAQVLPDAPAGAPEHLYDGMRNGLYHDGFTAPSIAISRSQRATLDYQGETVLVINTLKLSADIRRHFAAYITSLAKAPQPLKDQFETSYDRMQEFRQKRGKPTD